MYRIFIAATIVDSQREALVRSQQMLHKLCHKVGLTKPDKLHLTLRFIGEVDANKLKAIKQVMSALPLTSQEDYWTRITGYGRFKRQDGDLIYARMEVSRPLIELVRSIDDQLLAVDIKPDGREWLPHITVARRAVFPKTTNELPSMILSQDKEPVADIQLMLSEFTRQGMKYTPLLKRFS